MSPKPSRFGSKELSRTILGPWCLASSLVSLFGRNLGIQTSRKDSKGLLIVRDPDESW